MKRNFARGGTRPADKGKAARFAGFALLLAFITILPQYELVRDRHYKTVDLSEADNEYKLKAGDRIEQRIFLDEGDSLDRLSLYVSVVPWLANDGAIRFTLKGQDAEAASELGTASIVQGSWDCWDAGLELSGFDGGEAILGMEVVGLDEESGVYVRFTGDPDYGLPSAVLNGKDAGGTLSLNLRVRQEGDFEYEVSVGLMIAIAILSLLSSYIIAYRDENPRTGWILMGLEALLASATLALQYPGFTYEGQSNFEGATFFIKTLPVCRRGGLWRS